ncbi:MAG: ferritin-like domain-containing protein [Caldilineaceae bacterium]|nr:ferritin-like domain-containing protein [Caldilineaceae bacterium]
MDMNLKVNELLDLALSRRNYVAGTLAGGVAALATPLGLGRAFAQGMSDVDILQFALTLEHLEARMYRDMLATNILSGKEMQYFQRFGAHEAAHVDALTSALNSVGADPVAAQESYNFPPFNNRGDILNFARTAEELGVGAYQGAAPAISNADYLAAAGSIVQVEARHAAIVRILIGAQPAPAAVTASRTVDQVLDVVNPILGN